MFLKKTLYRRLFAVFLAFVVIASTTLFYLRPQATEAAWFDDSYAYRQKITFVHNAALTNAGMRLTVSNTNTLIVAGKMQVDCDDSRFTDSNGNVLRYKLVSGCNSASTVYDVVFPTVLNGTNLAFFYYGNPSAASLSDSSVPTGTTPSGTPSFATEENGLGPVIHYKFDEGYGTTVHNLGSAGASVSGTLNNMSAPPASTSGWTDYGKVNKALNFDGYDDYVEAPFSQSLNSDSVTVSFWFTLKTDPECDTANNWRSLIRKSAGTSATSTGWDIVLEQNKLIQFDLGLGGTPSRSGGQDVGIQVNKPVYLTFTYDAVSGDQKVWSNGALVSTKSNTPTAISLNSSNLFISKGASAAVCPAGAGYPTGQFDELKIYNYALTEAQVKSDYNRNAAAVMGSSEKSWLTDGLVGYWKLDDGVGSACAYGVDKACDSSGLNQTGTWTNGAASASGKFGNGIDVESTADQYITIPQLSITSASQITASLWFKPESSANGYVLSNSGGWVYIREDGAQDVIFKIETTSTYTCTTTGDLLPNGSWSFITLQYDGTRLRGFINGIEACSTPATGTIPTLNNEWRIGGRPAITSEADGVIDDVRVYNRALSGQEISRLADWAPEPVGWWKLDERSGTTAYDSSGNNLTGTLTNNPLWARGKVGSGISFDGDNDLVTVSDNDLLTPPGDMTISFWAKLDQLASTKGEDMDFITKNNSSGVPDWNSYDFFQRASDNKLVFLWVNESGGNKYTVSDTILETNKWYYITFVNNSTVGKIYINGIDNTTTTEANTGTLHNSDSTLNIGANSTGGLRVDGSMDDVRIYNYARSAKQIISDMNAGHPAVGSPVGSAIGHWRFDEGYGTTAKNSGSGGTALNGTLTTMDSPATYGSGWTNNGKFGKALNFDGVSDYINLNHPPSSFITASSGTISIWAKPDGASASQTNVYDLPALIGDEDQFIGIHRGNPNSEGDRIWAYNWDGTADKVGVTYTPGEWIHIVMVHDNGTLSIYKNGKLEGSTASGDTSSLAGINLYAGAGGSATTYYKGALDELKIYNYGLSADEVKTEYNQGKSLVLGALATDANGQSTNSAARAYCPPGNTETNCAAGLNPAPVGHWTLDERRGLTANDISGNTNTGTLTNGPNWTTGKLGQAINLDGTDDHIAIPVTSSTDIQGNEITLSAWIYATSLAGTNLQRILSMPHNGEVGTEKYALLLDNSSDELQLWIGLSVDDHIGADYSGYLNGWHYVAGVYSNDVMRIYIDGVLVSGPTNHAGAGTIRAHSLDDMRIGSYSDTFGQFFLGKIDDVRIYNYVRSPAQIAWDYNRGGPVGHWKFDECQGATAYDSSGNHLNATIGPGGVPNSSVGTCNSGTDSEMWNDGTNGKFNSALGFDGNDMVSVADNPTLSITGEITLAAWYRYDGKGTDWGRIITKTWADSPDVDPWFSYALGLDDGAEGAQKVGMSLEQAIGTSCDVQYSRPLQVGTWYHIVGTFKPSVSCNLYINGALVDSLTTAMTSIADTTGTFSIGNEVWSGNAVVGLIDDVRVYRYALSPTQVKLLYNDNSGVRFAPLTGSP